VLPAFQSFLDAHRDDIWRFLVSTVGRQEAEDCFQETCLAALRAYPNLDNGTNLKSWVLTIAYRKAIDARRATVRRRRAATETVARVDSAAADGVDPDLWRAIRRLPERQRTAVIYRYVNDLAYKDIAEAMSCSVEAARRSVHEGIKKLREVINR